MAYEHSHIDMQLCRHRSPPHLTFTFDANSSTDSTQFAADHTSAGVCLKLCCMTGDVTLCYSRSARHRYASFSFH